MSRGVKPDYEYTGDKLSISEAKKLKQRLLEKCHQLDMKAMAEDVEPFLFTSRDSRKVTLFIDLVQQYQFLENPNCTFRINFSLDLWNL